MQLLVSAWNDVGEETLINCLWKAKIFKKDQMKAAHDVDYPFNELNESLMELQTKYPFLVPENMTVQDVT